MTGAFSLDESIRRAVASRLEDARVPGCSLAVVDRDGRVDRAEFGVADLASGTRVGADTAFHLYSATKLYTAAAVMVLVERGLVDLDDPVEEYLDDLGLAHPVTVRQLASHSSGLRDTLRAFLAVHFPEQPAPSTGEALARYRLDRGGPPGEVAYRNVNFALLGELISRVSGRPYEELLSTVVLGPLGSGAGFSPPSDARVQPATGYLGRFDPKRPVLRLLVPATAGRLVRHRSGPLVGLREFALDSAAVGGLIGTATDFVPLLSLFLGDDDRVLARGTREAMLTVQVSGKAGIASTVGVGLGWKAGEVDGTRFWNHEGGGPGFTSETRLYPEDGLGLVVLMNRTHKPALSMLAHDLCELVR